MTSSHHSQNGPALNLLDSWRPGCWCGAALKLCDQRIVETGEALERYPEQWMYVLWRPMLTALPFVRPDCWGHSVGRPWLEVEKAVEDAPLYLLKPHECLWSAWIDLSLVCDRFVPWFTEVLQVASDAQRRAEREQYAFWYGSGHQKFQQFMAQVVGGTAAETELAEMPEQRLPLLDLKVALAEVREQRLPAGPHQEGRVAELPGGSLRIERVDGFGRPLERYEVNAGLAQLLFFGLHQRTGLQIPDAQTFLLLLPRCFVAWFDFKDWLMGQGIPLEKA